ncbi:MAG: energy transducer TonB [Nitrospirae bacterium]|nr:energy transducer TonB [Nitrospirota bacterium]
MTIKKFLALSIIVHIMAAFCIYRFTPLKEGISPVFSTMLVSPESLKEPGSQEKQRPALPLVKPPVINRADKIPPVTGKQKGIPGPFPGLVKPAQPLSSFDDAPIVHGEGKDFGRPLPEGIRPPIGLGDEIKDSQKTPETAIKGRPGAQGKGNLFDPAITEEIAGKDIGKKGTKMSKNEAVTFDTREYRYAGYNSKLRSRIESIWIYPIEAQMNGIYGDLKIRFTIKKDGRLGSIELIRTSGYKMLDDAAMKALRQGEPYWPLPDDWGVESYTISGHFIYNIYGYRLR